MGTLPISQIPEQYRRVVQQAYDQGCTAQMRRKHIAIFVPATKKTVVIPVSPSSHFGAAMCASDLRRAGLTINGRGAADAPKPALSKLVPGTDEAVLGHRRPKPTPGRRNAILALVTEHEDGISQEGVAARLAITPNNARTQLQTLRQMGKVRYNMARRVWLLWDRLEPNGTGPAPEALSAPAPPPEPVSVPETVSSPEAVAAPPLDPLRAFWRHASAAALALAEFCEEQGR